MWVLVLVKTQDYQLYLFDMDGLLIDTEGLHFQAYQRFLQYRDCQLPWTFEQYLQIAHRGSSSLKEAIFRLFPSLQDVEGGWPTLYEEKKQAYMEVLYNSPVEFMPGVQDVLTFLIGLGKTLCVVTNSTKEQIEVIQSRLPLLCSIEGWVPREDYDKPKPDSQCYKVAIDRWAYPGFKMIGFEDSARGLISLLGTSATAILVSSYQYPQLDAYEGRYTQISSFNDVQFLY